MESANHNAVQIEQIPVLAEFPREMGGRGAVGGGEAEDQTLGRQWMEEGFWKEEWTLAGDLGQAAQYDGLDVPMVG